MTFTRRSMIALGAGAAGACANSAALYGSETALLVDPEREPDFSIDLWPNGAPGGANVTIMEKIVERENEFNLRDRALLNVIRPRLDVFRPANPDGSAILIAPGGGYRHVVVDKEGYEGARWFSRRGPTVYVLFYRLPHQGWAAGPDTPLQDAQRAIRLIRARANEDSIDPDNVTVVGFSAGGHVAGSLATRFGATVYDAVDSADDFSARPDRAALVYPVITMKSAHTHKGSQKNLIGENPLDLLIEKYSIENDPPTDTPPIFLLHAADDVPVPVENSTALFAALQATGVPTALHIFTSGGHGFGLRGIENAPQRRWPEMLLEWAAI